MQFEYGLEQKVPFLKSFLFGLQWAALTISAIIMLGKVVGGLHFADSLSQNMYLQKILFIFQESLLVVHDEPGHLLRAQGFSSRGQISGATVLAHVGAHSASGNSFNLFVVFRH